jgi:hypothetical protein
VTTPQVVTLLPDGTVDVRLRIDCSPPQPGLTGPEAIFTTQPVTAFVLLTQDNGVISGHGNLNQDIFGGPGVPNPPECGEQSVNVAPDRNFVFVIDTTRTVTNSPPFHLGEAQISVTAQVEWAEPPPADPHATPRGGRPCDFLEELSVDGTTLITNSGTQPPGVPAPFPN